MYLKLCLNFNDCFIILSTATALSTAQAFLKKLATFHAHSASSTIRIECRNSSTYRTSPRSNRLCSSLHHSLDQ